MAWTYLSDCSGKNNRFTTEKDLECWFQRRQKSFDEGYMAITGFSYNG
jgi:hypothetical protein